VGRGPAEIDVTDGAAVSALVARVRPDVVFNATAWNRVDAAEGEPQAAFAVNALAPLVPRPRGAGRGRPPRPLLDRLRLRRRGHAPLPRGGPPRPLGVYGASKLAGEHLVAAAGGEHLLVRTSGVLGRGGSEQKGGSFVERVVAQARAGRPLRVVDDQVFAPTCAADLAAASAALVRAGARGLVHVTNGGSCSWHELAVAALAAAGLDAPVERARTSRPRPGRAPARLLRPRQLALPSGSGLPPLRHWRDALPDCLVLAGDLTGRDLSTNVCDCPSGRLAQR
jgi:dTDP-4-dehydrorhamnose reductase